MPLIDEKNLVLEVPGWSNPRTRTGLDDASLDKLGASILKEGLLYELLVWQPGISEPWLVIDGQRRLRAIRRLRAKWTAGEVGATAADGAGWPPFFDGIPCKIIENAPNFLDATYKALTTYQREKLSSYELVVRLAEIKRQHPTETNRKLALQVQKPEAWISKMFKVSRHMSEALEVAWRDDKLTDEQVQLVAELPLEKQEATIKTALSTRAKGKGEVTRKLRKKQDEKAVPARSGEDLEELLAVVEAWEDGPYKDGARDALLWALKKPIHFTAQLYSMPGPSR